MTNKIKLLFLILLVKSNGVFATDTLFTSTIKGSVDVSINSYVLIDKSAKIKINDLVNNPDSFYFFKSLKTKNNFGINNDAIWYKFYIKNDDAVQKHFVLDINLPTTNSAILYKIQNNSVVDSQVAGIDYVFVRSHLNSFTPTFEINLEPNKEYTFLVRIQTLSLKIISLKLYEFSSYVEAKQKDSVLHFLLLGIILATFFYNLILFFLTKEKTYLFLSLGLLSASIFYAFYYGTVFYIDLNIPVYFRSKLRIFSYYLASLFFILFTIFYLDIQRKKNLTFIILHITAIYFVLSSIYSLLPFFDFILFNKISLITYPLYSLLQIIIGISLISQKRRTAFYFVISYGFFVIGTIIHTLTNYEILEHNIFTGHISIVTMTIFALVLTVGLTEKITNIRREQAKNEQLLLDNQSLQNEINHRKIVENELYEHKRDLETIIIKRTKELSDKEEKYRELVEQIDDWIWQTDKQGTIVFSNKSVENILGYKTEQVVGKHYSNFLNIPDILNIFAKENINRLDYETQTVNIAGEELFLTTSIKQICDDNQNLIGLQAITRDITEKKNIDNKILKTIIETEEKERRRVAIELHDGLGSTLSGINMYLNILQIDTIDEKLKKDTLTKVQNLIRLAANDVRNIAYNLRPYELSHVGLCVSIENMFNRMVDTQKVAVSLDTKDYYAKLDSETELTIFRIITELTNNTLKHSAATQITLKIFNDLNNVFIEYTDNGVGCDLNEVLNSKTSMGLQNIITRLQTINGTVRFDSQLNNGFRVYIQIKL